MNRNFWILLFGSIFLLACNRTADFFAQDVETPIWTVDPIDSVVFDNDEGIVNIHTVADANFKGLKNAADLSISLAQTLVIVIQMFFISQTN